MTDGLIERERMQQSLHLAREVQQNLLPKSNLKVNGFDIAGKSVYCDETGGDYYDFITIKDNSSEQLGVVVADVVGHGISSALIMASVRSAIRQRLAMPGSISQIITDVNCQLAGDLADYGQFVTLFYMLVDPARHTLEWVRAGHDPAIFYDPQTDTFEELRGDGIALGVDMHGHYAQYQKTNLKKGQIVLLGSDGLWEARNPAGEMFGKEPICEITRKLAQASAREILTSCFHGFNVFLGDRAPEDDVTLVVIKISED